MSSLLNPIFVLVIAQVLFTGSDLFGRYVMNRPGDFFGILLKPWMVGYVLLRLVASLGQLYVFSKVEVGKTMAIFGAVSIVLANVLGYLLLKEALSASVYVGVSFAIFGFLILAFR